MKHENPGLIPIKRLLENEDGATIMEYALICTLIAVVCVAAISIIGHASSQSLNSAAVSI